MVVSAGGPIGQQYVDSFLNDISSVMKPKEVNRISMKAMEPPSFIQLLAQAIEWIDPLKIAATAFLAQIAKEAGKDFWKNKAKIALFLKDVAVKPLKVLASSIAKQLKAAANHNFHFAIGLPFPDDYFGTIVSFDAEDEEFIAWAIANFVLQAEKIEKAVLDEMKGKRQPLGLVKLRIQSDGSFILEWMDQEGLEHHQKSV